MRIEEAILMYLGKYIQNLQICLVLKHTIFREFIVVLNFSDRHSENNRPKYIAKLPKFTFCAMKQFKLICETNERRLIVYMDIIQNFRM